MKKSLVMESFLSVLTLIVFVFVSVGFTTENKIDPKAYQKRGTMKKIKVGKQQFLPMPVVIIGAKVDGKVNFQTACWINFVNWKPPLIYVALNKEHLTTEGVVKTGRFSVNLPASDMMVVTDYIGTHSGRDVDKTKLFKVFYGESKDAPMIKECPINIECKVIKKIEDYPSNYVFIAEIIETCVGEEYQSESGMLDMKKLDPMFVSFFEMKYRTVGDAIGTSSSVGNDFKP
jgi:flavin reductase (DIM6/NTAB) family NADH-FMN oxidoreductase RutF